MNSPVVSLGVCITYHNERELLTENLNSLTDLLPGVDKVYVYDDASQYPARDWIPAGMQVEVVRGESNIGPGRARNVLWRQCDADYIHFHDADDIFLPGWAQRVRAEIQRTGCDAVLTETNAFRDGKTVGERGFDLAGVRNNDDLLDYAIRRSMLTLTGTWKRQLLETTGGYDEGLWQSEDYDLNIRLVALRPSFSIILDPLVSIRIHAGNRSRLHVEVYR
ncbi:MAG: glycosyltransferase family 2 protein, partial [Pseudomonadota bacterium]